MQETKTIVETIISGIQEKKGTAIAVVDLSAIDGAICRQFVICQGGSPAQVEAITFTSDFKKSIRESWGI